MENENANEKEQETEAEVFRVWKDYLQVELADGTRCELADMHLVASIDGDAYQLHSNAWDPSGRMFRGVPEPGSMHRRVVALTLLIPYELLTDEEQQQLLGAKLVLGVCLLPPEDQRPVSQELIDSVPACEAYVPLVRILVQHLAHDSFIRAIVDQQDFKADRVRNVRYDALSNRNWHLRQMCCSCWNKSYVLRGVKVCRKDPNFFKDRVRRADDLFRQFVYMVGEIEGIKLNDRAVSFAADYQAILSNEEDPANQRKQEEYVQEMMGRHLKGLIAQYVGLPEDDPLGQIVRDMQRVWEIAPEDHERLGIVDTLSHLSGFVELETMFCPPKRQESLSVDQLPDVLMATRAVTRVDYRPWPVEVKGTTDIPHDEELLGFLHRSLLIDKDKETGEYTMRAPVLQFFQDMMPGIEPGPMRAYFVRPKREEKREWLHHLTMSFFASSPKNVGECVNKLILHLKFANDSLVRGEAEVTIPWRQIYRQWGLLDESTGLGVSLDAAARGEVQGKSEPILVPVTLNGGEQWTLSVQAIPYMYPIPLSSQTLLNKQRMAEKVLDNMDLPSSSSSESEPEPAAANKLDDGTEVTRGEELIIQRSRITCIHGLYLCATLYPNFIGAPSPIYRDRELFEKTMRAHKSLSRESRAAQASSLLV